MRPLVGVSNKLIQRSKVDFPDPEAPMMEITSFFYTEINIPQYLTSAKTFAEVVYFKNSFFVTHRLALLPVLLSEFLPELPSALFN
jgi:hypothetical protein